MRSNGLVPVLPCISLPGQVLAAATDDVVHFLALVSDSATVRRRIADRQGVSAVPSPETHVEFDRSLRATATVPAPHTWTVHEVSDSSVEATRAAGVAWATQHTRG